MDKYTILKQNPKKSLRLIGVEIELFDSILEKVQKYIDEEKANNTNKKLIICIFQ